MPLRVVIQWQGKRRTARRGIVLIAVIVTIGLCLALFGIWARSIVREHRAGVGRQHRQQAIALAEAGIQRAVALRAANPSYEQESWITPADRLSGSNAAQVQIRVTPLPNDAGLRYEAVAQFPAESTHRAQVTKRLDLTTPPIGSQP